MTSIAIDPIDPANVYAATETGVFRSEDRGESWAPLGVGLRSAPAHALAIVPVGGRTLLAAADEGAVQRVALRR